MLVELVRRYDEVTWLHQMRQLVQRWWNIGVIYVDKEANPIFLSGQPHKFQNRICAICLSGGKGQQLCSSSMKQAHREVEKQGRPGGLLSFGCHLGLTAMAVPIIIEDRFSGMIYTTGFFNHPPRQLQLTELLERGSRINPALGNEEILRAVPTISGEDLGRLEDFIQLGISAIVTLYSQLRSKEEEIESLRKELLRRDGYAGLVGRSPGMQEVYALIERVADNDCTVLVRGGSGTGKELVAQAIHSQSHRKDSSFVVQNCSAFNDNLLESELFGHVRGAFTGAVNDKRGLFEIASGGSLFLDEVAEMSPALQAKLLRVLQDGTFWPVGASSPEQCDVRIVAATHRDLEAMVEDESFREDLYYRLNVISIVLPPLRERRGDIPALVRHFLKRHGEATMTPEALRTLSNYDWHGNVRELANEIERMTVLADGSGALGRELISSRILDADRPSQTPLPTGTLKEAQRTLEARMISAALEECGGNRSRSARLLGIARSNLIVKIRTYGLT